MALYHFSSTSHINDLPILKGAYLFVDFFFVLSGFVIFASYQKKLSEGFGVGRFLFLRFGRLYPLHFALLVAFIGADLLKLIPSLGSYSAYKPFTSPGQTAPFIISNLLLIQSLGIHDQLSLNDASWSISVEFYTYVLFGLALVALRNRIKWLIVGFLILTPIFLASYSPHYMDTTFQYGFIRCVFGFSAGALCWILFERYHTLAARRFAWPRFWDGMEIMLVLLVMVFVTISGTGALTLAAPVLFSFTILVFAMDRGIVSRLLTHRVFTFLGLLSYSIYMDHMFIKRKLFDSGALVVNKLFHVSLITTVNGDDLLGTSPWQGDLLSVLYLVILVGVSYITFHTIEEPCRKWSKSFVRSHRRPRTIIQSELAVPARRSV